MAETRMIQLHLTTDSLKGGCQLGEQTRKGALAWA